MRYTLILLFFLISLIGFSQEMKTDTIINDMLIIRNDSMTMALDAYARFKNRNFTVLGVSLDQPEGKDDWMNAVMKDRLTWTQVSDLQYWNSPVVPLYNIQGIPYNVLVDPNGKVVAESLRGEQLAATLEQVLPK